jgi:carboxypeptidase family protein/TonB-dependent receptor-like protein
MRTSIMCLLALLLSVAGASHTIAQNIKAALNGRVLDTQNNVVANAAVTVIDTQRGQQRTVVSDNAGAFHLPGLEPGTYRVVVEVSGFAPYESAEINLRVGDAPNFDVRLQLSQFSAVVNIVDALATLQTTDIKESRSFTSEEMNDLPTAAGTQGRNFYTQARTAPGVSLSTKAHQPFSVSGQRAINNNYLIDSVDNNDPNAGLIAGRGANEQLISQEAIQSFEVLTHNFNTWLLRGDVALTDRQRLMSRYNIAKAVSEVQGGFAGVIDGVNNLIRTTMSASVQHTWTLAPNKLNEARVGFNRTESLDVPSDNLLLLGDPKINGEVGQLRVNGLTTLGVQSFANKYEFLNNYQISDDFTWSLRNHTLKFGSSARRVQVNDGFLDNAYRGQLVFNNISDFISGKPASYLRRVGNPRIGLRRTEWHSFAQDDWRVTPALTLNIGLRYELNTALREVVDRIPSQFLLNTDRNNFAPRFGFAWQALPRTVVRGGYGIYYNALETVFLGLTRYNPPLIQTFTVANPTLPNLLDNATAGIPSGLVIPNKDTATPYAQHINLTVERELWNPQSTVSVAYVGTLGRKESRLRLPNGGENAAGFRRPDPTVGVVSVLETSANSSYHSFQMSWSQRVNKDLQVRAAYTFSKYLDYVSGLTSSNTGLDRTQIPLDERDLSLDRGRSDFDIPHIFTLTGIWRAPFFANRRGLVGGALGGWSLSSVATLQSGRTYTLFSGTNNLNASNNNRLLDLPGTLIRCGSCSTPIRLADGVTKAQLTPAAGALGALGRNGQRTDGLVDIAFSLSKDFRVTERLRVQLRGEIFNAFNVANFNAVDNVLVSPNFGRYTSAFDSRRAQLVARVIF